MKNCVEQQPFDIQRSLSPDLLSGRQTAHQPLTNGESTCLPETRAAYQQSICHSEKHPGASIRIPREAGSQGYFFKGMYSDLTDRSICLKLWNGEKWIWTDCNLKGRSFPQDGQLMSPTLVKEGRRYLLNIPVKQENSDARTAKERMAEGTNLCSVRFTNTDTFAVCCILDEQGNQLAVHTCRGGDAYRHRCKLLETRIQKSRPNTVGDNSPQPNRKYYMHLKNLSEHYAHQVSREILNFCKENQAGIIVLPDYDQNFTRMAMVKSGNFSPLHLSSKIRTNLQYKAWAEGILVLETRTDGLKDKCAICGGKVRRKEMNSSVKMVIRETAS